MTHDAVYSKLILDVIPSLMHLIRTEMRGIAEPELTVPQFRVMARLYRVAATNQELAAWIGVSAPSMTRMVDILVEKDLIKRTTKTGDRRQNELCLTENGKTTFERIRMEVQLKLTDKLSKLSKERKLHLKNGLEVLRETFL